MVVSLLAVQVCHSMKKENNGSHRPPFSSPMQSLIRDLSVSAGTMSNMMGHSMYDSNSYFLNQVSNE